MFCPFCGIEYREENFYCRHCGQNLPDWKLLSTLSFGGKTPQENIRKFGWFSLLCGLLSLLVGLWMYITDFRIPFVYYLGLLVLLGNSILQFISFYLMTRGNSSSSTERNHKYRLRETQEPISIPDFVSSKPPLPPFKELVPIVSITETTTDELESKL